MGVLPGLFVLAVVARCLDFFRVFTGEGEVVFAAGDAFYHARRAFASFVDFPALLRFDPCLNYPDGAVIPHPPLLDWTTAALARAFGDSVASFEWTAAWLPVLLSSAAVFPIYALGRLAFDGRIGALAAAIYAVLPICINYGQLGNFDHHAPAGLIGSCLIVLYARELAAPEPGPSASGWLLALVAARIAMLLTWTGSLLYLIPGEAALMVLAAERRDPTALRRLARGALATAGLALLLALALRPAVDAQPFTAVEFSRLHGLFYLALAALGFGFAVFLGRQPGVGEARARAVLALLAGGIAALAFSLRGVRAAFGEGLGFLAADDGYTETVVEQLPLFFGEGAYSLAVAHARMGGFAYLVPLVPVVFALLARERARLALAIYLAGFGLLLSFLAFGQVRYVHDLAPLGCVAFAWCCFRGARVLAERLSLRAGQGALACGLAAILWLPSIPGFFGPLTGLLASGLRGDLAGLDRALLSVPGSQLRFAQLVEQATPGEGACPAGRGEAPAYGVLAHVGLGHALHYSGRRATPADPFGPYIGRENFAAVRAFFEAEREARAAAILEGLDTPYVATAADALERSTHSMAHRLHALDGSFASGVPALGRFRLVTEGPLGGTGMEVLFGADEARPVPYKLFEQVAGAQLRVEAPAGSLVTAELPLKTPAGRSLVYRVATETGAGGVARFRVPYASARARERKPMRERVERVTPLSAYRVEVPGRRYRVFVSEEDVRSGRTLDVASFASLAID